MIPDEAPYRERTVRLVQELAEIPMDVRHRWLLELDQTSTEGLKARGLFLVWGVLNNLQIRDYLKDLSDETPRLRLVHRQAREEG